MRTLWNDHWSFVKLPVGSRYEDMKKADMQPVILPHDWLIAQTDDLYESADGWYRKSLSAGEAAGGRVWLDFDGVYMDCDVLINGRIVLTHHYGYTPFFVDVGDLLLPGDNEIAVHIRFQSPNSRWYSGAGLFRDVYMLSLPERCMRPDGFQVNTAWDGAAWHLTAEAELMGPGESLPCAALFGPEGEKIAEAVMRGTETGAALQFDLTDIQPWSCENPALYELRFFLEGQEERMAVGFRQTDFTPDRGFFLNGKHVKLHGVCLHHDLGALGAAFHEKAAERQLRKMMAMGVNAIRTSHNPPARRLLDLCDRLGIMVVDELYDMWELPKTDYDHARFFQEDYPADVAAWIRRDRCHPCVILWSIGNEISDMQVSERGRMWTVLLAEEVHRHDTRHAPVTFGCNYMPWEGAQQCADVIKIPGYNYAERLYAEHHRKHPDWVIYGSETASLLFSRGIYHFPMGEAILAEEDLQCSSLLNSNTSWGAKDIRRMMVEDRLTDYSLGQFLWSGIDYIGEPTPYQTRNCYFGQMDTACFPKDSYFFIQAMWTQKPMIHIGIYWDWNPGQLIDVPVMTNGESAELFLNGRSLGRKQVRRDVIEECLPVWQVPYEPGVLSACAYDAQGGLLCETARTSFGEAVKLVCSAEETRLRGGCGDMAFITVSAVDAKGHPVENANCRVHAEVSGCGVLLGMDNGDSTDRDEYQTFSKRLFSGKLLMIVGAQAGGGAIHVRVTGAGLEPAELSLEVAETPAHAEKRTFPDLCRERKVEDGAVIRKIELTALSETALSPERPSVAVRLSILPEEAADQPMLFRMVNAQGVTVPYASLSRQDDLITVTAQGDGACYLRAAAANGDSHTRILSSLEITASGFGALGLDPYGFVSASLCDARMGDIGAGNEQGIAFARGGESAVGFTHVDFGGVGSDEITLPIFAMDDDRYLLKIWDGMPGQGGRLIAELPYQKKCIWNTYQAETYRLPEILTGVHCIAFSMNCEMHLKGFSFTRQSRATRYCRAVDADRLYGDRFEKDPDAVRNIGNNVTLTFLNMDFEKTGKMRLMIDGATARDVNPVSLRVTDQAGKEVVSTCNFIRSDRCEQEFPVEVAEGRCAVSFVFLPGSSFDFYGFRFEPAGA
ncbi:MAG: DUF4982 domain-containing protein [Clostridia bacterium]|nr:DUF4982 domain-containing protein [Clostridia bacterium]